MIYMFSTSSTYNPQLHMSFPISPQMNNPISFKSYMKLCAQVKFANLFFYIEVDYITRLQTVRNGKIKKTNLVSNRQLHS
jgi:hypothetical protein